MENIFSGFNISDMTAQATNMFTGLAPVVELILGILLAFFIIRQLIFMIKKDKNNNDDYNEGENTDDDNWGDDDYGDWGEDFDE